MNEPWENIDTSKATADIETELFKRVKSHLHYGQMTKLFRNVFESIDVMIQNEQTNEIHLYIAKRKSLLLKPVDEVLHDINVQN